MDDVYFPKAMIIPQRELAKQVSTSMVGSIGMSGAYLVFFDGSAWKTVTAA